MRIHLLDNISGKVADAVLPSIAAAQECRIAVAFASVDGLSLVEPALRECLARGGRAEFLLGLDLWATEPRALWTLYQMSQADPRVACYCLSELRPSGLYHPKLYMMKDSDTASIVVGSSNLTEGGLKTNVEVNAFIHATLDEEIVSDTYAVYNSLKFRGPRVSPDEEFLALYERMYSFRKGHDVALQRDSGFRELRAQFKQKAASLRRPVATARDLFGWQRLVYDRLPDGQFKTRDTYQFEEDFRRAYPENQNIRPKVRQILQQLRDLNLLRHVARETWIKEVGGREAGAR